MFETLFCSLITILPDYLFRRYVQGKRIGHEITLYSVWYELRYGIAGCFVLSLTLFTTLFYFHPATSNVTASYRTVTILPEVPGRVVEVFVENGEELAAGDPIFQIDDARQQAALDTARATLDEIDAEIVMAAADLRAATATVNQAQALLDEYETELGRTQELMDRGSSAVSEQQLDQQVARAEAQAAAVEAARSQEASSQARVETLLPAEKASAEAAVRQAQVELELTTIYAGTDGTLEQFALQPGDYVSSIMRPAGLIVPDGKLDGHARIQAAFDQISARVIKVGMVAEAFCISMPFTIIPLVVVDIQDVVAGGAFRPTDGVVDLSQRQTEGTILAIMEPLYPGGLDEVLPGSVCMANAYTSTHERRETDESLNGVQKLGLHVVETIGLVHAAGLRLRAILAPLQRLVLTGGH
ncbi:MAG: biotin/lipoyl-binding protein [Pseudomonadota bacterium]